MPAAAAIAVATIAAGTAGYTAYQSSQDRDAAQNERGRQEKLAEKAQADAQAQSDKEKADILAARTASDNQDILNAQRIAQQRRRAAFPTASGMKGGTILTGAQGISTPASTAATKTLLGQ